MRHDGDWFFPAGTLRRDGWETVVDAGIRGWQHTGLRIGSLIAGTRLTLEAGDVERIVIPLSGSCRVTLLEPSEQGAVFELAGRRSVFEGPTDVLYFGAGERLEPGADLEVQARAERGGPPHPGRG